MFFATKFRNHEVEFFLAMRNLKPSFETNICSAGFPVYKSMENIIKDAGCFLSHKLTGLIHPSCRGTGGGAIGGKTCLHL